MTKYKVFGTEKSTMNTVLLYENLSLSQAFAIVGIDTKDSPIDGLFIEYNLDAGETDEQARYNIIDDVKSNNLSRESFSIVLNNTLLLTSEMMKSLTPVNFVPAEQENPTPSLEFFQKKLDDLEKTNNNVEITSSTSDNIKILTYDVTIPSFPFTIASGLYLERAAAEISEAIQNGENINSPRIINALNENESYTREVCECIERLKDLLVLKNRQPETFEEKMIDCFSVSLKLMEENFYGTTN